MILALVASLMIVGAVLTLGGLAWGARRLIAEHRSLAAKLDEIDRIIHEPSLTSDEKEELMTALLPRTSTWNDISYFREWVRRFILEQAVTNLGWPAALTAIGVVTSTAAGVWALWA